jgi:hypothetical protein
MTAADEKAILLTRLRDSAATFVNAARVDDQLAAVCPDTNCWSILQIAEHLGMTERGMFSRLAVAEAKTTEPDYAMDQKISHIGRDRSGKRNAPERAHPTGKFASIKDALANFQRARQETIDFLQNSTEDLRKKKVIHPLAEMDGHQLFLLMSAHAERHAAQVEEVKKSPAYLASGQHQHAV